MDFTGEAQLGDVVRIEGEFVVAFGVAESPGGDGLYGSPPGRSFCAYKRNQNTLGAAPQDPDASEPPRPESQSNGFPERD